MGTQRLLGIAAAGVGVVGVVLGGVFGLMAISEKNQQVSDCPNSNKCVERQQAFNDHSTGLTDSTVSTVGFVAGGALLAGGAALFFTGGHGSERPAPGGVMVLPSAGREGGGIAVRGEF